MINKDYMKVFNKDLVKEITVRLINEGFSYMFIAKILGCEEESVAEFKRKKVADGYIFKEHTFEEALEINDPLEKEEKKTKFKRNVNKSKFFRLGNELVVRPKTYSYYLLEEKRKVKAVVDERMGKARDTINELKKKRIGGGLIEEL